MIFIRILLRRAVPTHPSPAPYDGLLLPGRVSPFPRHRSRGPFEQETCRVSLDELHVLMLLGLVFSAAGEGHMHLACVRETEKLAF